MCIFYPSDSKILFNLWGWLWLSPMFLVSIPSAILLHKTILS
ncbi:hypothetical protein LEP1GSC077_3665 [Leptospira interrogans str. C10069]|nr:hypothetical protein LEP1GSC077_0995 [Leptospira interrogans str. C10069]EKO08792.1 hypothetical protein LEP1GSC077_3665 [Leptospira interrogans str. C10069]EKO98245.1 hypothetical protein LEP1GSC057_3065 [Leptospira interrogans str. Brem 329]EMN61431.1 hypothetical protein LEP1GSC092_2436 [Leptospira interrogans serovar Pyrogenes str. R168]